MKRNFSEFIKILMKWKLKGKKPLEILPRETKLTGLVFATAGIRISNSFRSDLSHNGYIIVLFFISILYF